MRLEMKFWKTQKHKAKKDSSEEQNKNKDIKELEAFKRWKQNDLPYSQMITRKCSLTFVIESICQFGPV